MGRNDDHDAIALPVGTGGLLPSLADPDLDVRVEQRRGVGSCRS
jgi:hypothetical protein